MTSAAFFSSSPSGRATRLCSVTSFPGWMCREWWPADVMSRSVQLPRILALSSGRCTTTPALTMLGLLQSSGIGLLTTWLLILTTLPASWAGNVTFLSAVSTSPPPNLNFFSPPSSSFTLALSSSVRFS